MLRYVRSLVSLLFVWVVAGGAAFGQPTLLFSYEVTSAQQFNLPNLRDAPYEQREELTRKAMTDIVPAILAANGVDAGKVETQVTPGGFLLRTNASLQSKIAIAPDAAERLAAAFGYVFRQNSVLVSDLGDGKGGTGYVTVRFAKGSLTPLVAQRFFEHAASVHKGLGGGYTAFGDEMIFLNVRDDKSKPYSELEDADFAAHMRTAAQGFAERSAEVAAVGSSRAHFVSNGWRNNPKGELYVAKLGGADGALVRQLDGIHERHVRLVNDAAQRWGWR